MAFVASNQPPNAIEAVGFLKSGVHPGGGGDHNLPWVLPCLQGWGKELPLRRAMGRREQLFYLWEKKKGIRGEKIIRECTSSPTVGLSHSADGKPEQQEGDGAWMSALFNKETSCSNGAAPPKRCRAMES